MKKLLMTLALMASVPVSAASLNSPLLVIGASLENGKSPCVIGKVNAFGCFSVGFGDYLSVGQALTRSRANNGSVLVEAIGGATTFDRPGYILPGETQAEVGWENEGYPKQFQRAVLSATNPITSEVNAKFIVIGMANDCLHSNAFVTAPSQSTQCTAADRNAVIDRYIAIGKRAIEAGLIPVYTGYPPLAHSGQKDGIDLAAMQVALGFSFVISDTGYRDMVSRFNSRIASELPRAVNAQAYGKYEHLGDGLHPTRSTVELAARKIMSKIEQADSGN